MELAFEDIRRAEQVCYEIGVLNSGAQISDMYIHIACANAPGGNPQSRIVYNEVEKKLKCENCGAALDEYSSDYVTKHAHNLLVSEQKML